MTIVVAFLCRDGTVVAADSMLTPSMGNINVGHHHGKKIELIGGDQVFAFSGDQGQAARFKFIADQNASVNQANVPPINYAVFLSHTIIQQFIQTGTNGNIAANTILCFPNNGIAHCCVFEGAMQPRLLDANHFYTALGSGKLSADPFLRFLVDIFCQTGNPSLREAVFLATWAVQYVIDTNPGGVAGPIRIATLEFDSAGAASARELPDTEIEEHKQAIESAWGALRAWRDGIQSGQSTQDVPPQPEAPPQIP